MRGIKVCRLLWARAGSEGDGRNKHQSRARSSFEEKVTYDIVFFSIVRFPPFPIKSSNKYVGFAPCGFARIRRIYKIIGRLTTLVSRIYCIRQIR